MWGFRVTWVGDRKSSLYLDSLAVKISIHDVVLDLFVVGLNILTNGNTEYYITEVHLKFLYYLILEVTREGLWFCLLGMIPPLHLRVPVLQHDKDDSSSSSW